ncbi:MAG: type II toxin-antitoxin system PemK/MazF family toxin [Acidimicrobiales bacterium]|nr:type II toxin-antitoxin system PemK/MazF family toxin [Acidimicrobiales bacterium]
MGALVVARAEVWWGETPDEKGRPFLVVSRDAANEVMQRVLVAPVTTRVRGVPSELALGADEGLPRPCVAAFDNVRPFPKAMLTRRLGALGRARRHQLCSVAAATLDC